MNILTICVRGCLESLGSTFNGECVATSKQLFHLSSDGPLHKIFPIAFFITQICFTEFF